MTKADQIARALIAQFQLQCGHLPERATVRFGRLELSMGRGFSAYTMAFRKHALRSFIASLDLAA